MQRFKHAFLLPERLSSVGFWRSWRAYGLDAAIEIQMKAMVCSRSPSPEDDGPAAKCAKTEADKFEVVARLDTGAFRLE
jgi:hypothetical protein